MSENKKFYWLRLKDDFFNQKEIKKLRSIAGGDTYTIIYLKLQLLSLCREGRLVYEGVEDNFISEMALEIDEPVDNVGITISFLEKHGLLESSDVQDVFLLPEAISNMGKITSEGIRKRAYRERITGERDTVPLLSEKRPPEKEKEKEKEKRVREVFISPTLEEVKALVIEKGYTFDPKYFFDYYEALDWKDVKSWKGKAVTWQSRQKPKPPTNAFKELPIA